MTRFTVTSIFMSLPMRRRGSAKPLANRAEVHVAHIPREQNAAADEMSNRAIDERL
jgi:hypothetical protein